MNDNRFTGGRPRTLLVCDDRPEVRDAICRAVCDLPGFEVAGEAFDSISCLEQIRELHPDVLSVDVSMPGGGPDLVRAVRVLHPEVHIIVFSGRDDRRLLNEMLAAGADHYVIKTGRLRPLIQALESAFPTAGREPEPEF
jgi:DNA-binding NarL/FixJ family response regulator